MDEMDKKEIIGIVINSSEFESKNEFFLENLLRFKEDLEGRIEEISRQFDNKSNELNEKYRELQAKNSQLENDKLQLEYRLQAKDQEIKSVKDRNEKLENEVSKLKSEKNALVQEKQELTGELERNKTETSSKIRYLENEVAELKREKNALVQENQELTGELERNKTETSSKIRYLENEVAELKREKNALEQKEQDLTQKLQREQSLVLELKDKLDELKIFVKAKNVFDVFNGLSAETKKRLEGIFASNSFEGFISNGVQFDNISMVWEFIKRKIIEKDTVDVDGLLQIFKFFFELYNFGFQSPRYVLLEPKVGDNFDRNSSSIIGTATTGLVTKVLIPGYKDLKTEKVNKAMVMVES